MHQLLRGGSSEDQPPWCTSSCAGPRRTMVHQLLRRTARIWSSEDQIRAVRRRTAWGVVLLLLPTASLPPLSVTSHSIIRGCSLALLPVVFLPTASSGDAPSVVDEASAEDRKDAVEEFASPRRTGEAPSVVDEASAEDMKDAVEEFAMAALDSLTPEMILGALQKMGRPLTLGPVTSSVWGSVYCRTFGELPEFLRNRQHRCSYTSYRTNNVCQKKPTSVVMCMMLWSHDNSECFSCPSRSTPSRSS